jgi:hypothetical protein
MQGADFRALKVERGGDEEYAMVPEDEMLISNEEEEDEEDDRHGKDDQTGLAKDTT